VFIIINANNNIHIIKNKGVLSYNSFSTYIPEDHLKAIIATVTAFIKRKKSLCLPTDEEIAVIKAALREYCRTKETRLIIRPPITNSAWKIAARLRM
jgi:hypothetical protein